MYLNKLVEKKENHHFVILIPVLESGTNVNNATARRHDVDEKLDVYIVANFLPTNHL